MKKFLTNAMAIGLLLLSSVCVRAQISGSSAFLQGNYVEVAVGGFGGYLTDEDIPAGYHFINALSGMISDSDKDGWEIGDPAFCGDYFAPGSPVEGFAIQVGEAVYYNEYGFASNDVPGEVVSYTETVFGSGGVAKKVTWQGSIAEQNLDVKQITTLYANKSWFVTQIYLTNTGTDDLHNLYYSRNTDPDNDLDPAGDFTTDNIIVYNQPADDWALVTAEGLAVGCYLGLGSKQTNAVAAYGGFSTSAVTPSDAYNGFGGHDISGSVLGDIAITLTFKINKLRPGQTKALVFIYGADNDDLLHALGVTTDEEAERLAHEINSLNGYNDTDISVSPNPGNGVFNISSGSDGELQIINMFGQVVYSQQIKGSETNQVVLNSNIPDGTYFVTLFSDGKYHTETVVLSR
ncbi:MAG: T9SS type A sorting domain-containing protein [Chitinophagales bacterium]|nr:T9SS type A sorting domain-containing protein [Chitinophagales bacterium]